MSQRLEERRADATPKCATCSWWQGGEAIAGRCSMHDMKTLDLAVCAGHRPQVQTGEVMEGGE